MKTLMTVICASLLAILAGCNLSDVAQSPDATAAQAVDTRYVAATEPDNAIPVGQARESIQDEQAVVMVGRIGGSAEPFVDGLAAFTIVDSKVPYCSADEGCPTPWDYCCTRDQVKVNIATVKIVDETGNPVAADARTLLGVKELSTVVVQGTARRDQQGNLTVAANKIYVRPSE